MELTRDLRAELEDQVDGNFPPAWKPVPGDILVGRLVGYSTGRGYRGREIYVAKIEVEDIVDGSPFVSVWLMSTVLFDEFRKQRPAPGERIGIARLTDGTSEAGQEYQRYRVTIDRVGESAIPDFGDPAAGPAE